MAKSIDFANAPEHAAVIEELLPQLLIVFLKRLGGSLDIPVSEIDDTGSDLMMFYVDPLTRRFHFEIQKKS